MTAQSGQKVFGSGRFFGIPNVTTPTPIAFLLAQNMSLDFRRDIKRLYGENQLPADVATGMMQISGKVQMGTLNARALNDLMIGGTLSTGQTSYSNRESVTPSTGAGGGAIATVALSSLWSVDLGVIDTVTGVPMTRVASTAPTSLQYYAAAGVYTFSSGGITAKVSYLYSPSTNGQNVTMTNQPMGKTGNFQAVMETFWGTEKSSIQLNSCMGSDMGFQTVLDDYQKPTFGFDAACDASDQLGVFSFAEIS